MVAHPGVRLDRAIAVWALAPLHGINLEAITRLVPHSCLASPHPRRTKRGR